MVITLKIRKSRWTESVAKFWQGIRHLFDEKEQYCQICGETGGEMITVHGYCVWEKFSEL